MNTKHPDRQGSLLPRDPVLILKSPDATAALQHVALNRGNLHSYRTTSPNMRTAPLQPSHQQKTHQKRVLRPRGCELSTRELPTEFPAPLTYAIRPATDELDEPAAAPPPPSIAAEEATAEASPPASASFPPRPPRPRDQRPQLTNSWLLRSGVLHIILVKSAH